MAKNLSTMRLLYFAAIIVGIVAGGLWLQMIVPTGMGLVALGAPLALVVLAVFSLQSASIDKTLEEDWGEKTLVGLFVIGLIAEFFIWGWLVPTVIFLFFWFYFLYWFFLAK